MTATVTLLRHFPSGRQIITPGLTKRLAYQLAGQLLYDNGIATKAAAQEWASIVPIGQRCNHPSGYGITILKEPRP